MSTFILSSASMQGIPSALRLPLVIVLFFFLLFVVSLLSTTDTIGYEVPKSNSSVLGRHTALHLLRDQLGFAGFSSYQELSEFIDTTFTVPSHVCCP